ncbi:hypothetical protein PVK06_011781 [Gossypium arboreum]|uniref:Uncharacterized protein n=1 Tax=Gossypium arboreum TaxID=29729 RepID=A0ABR0QA26_GOSAR|nr:hypothetical protein PVK06_011781 [Gossypium arboreum]
MSVEVVSTQQPYSINDGNFAFDPGDYCFISFGNKLFKGVESSTFVVQSHNSRNLDGSILTSMIDPCTHCETVRSISIFDPGNDVRWYPLKEGGHGNNPSPFRTICGSLDFGNNSVLIMNKMLTKAALGLVHSFGRIQQWDFSAHLFLQLIRKLQGTLLAFSKIFSTLLAELQADHSVF